MRFRVVYDVFVLYVIVLLCVFFIMIINIDKCWINHVMLNKYRIMGVVSQYNNNNNNNETESDFFLDELTVHLNTVNTSV